jgi:hypothetical protein
MIIKTEFQNVNITLAQAIGMHKLYTRYMQDIIVNSPATKILEFDVWVEKNASIAFGDNVMVEYAGMVVGIEKDGYTHT